MLPIWKLLGFALYITLYFSILEAYERWPIPSLKSSFFKILPILHLILIVVSSSTEEDNHTKPPLYRRFIMIGLCFSLAGDVALVYIKDFFELGVILFAVAQTFYLAAFGFRPFGSGPMATSFAIIGSALYLYVVRDLNEGVDIKLLLLVYTVLILIMAWRSAAQLMADMTVENLCACAGALLFVASDLILAIDKWKGSFQYAPFWNMATYYSAQLGIALSACNTLDAKFYSHIVRKDD